MESLIVALGRVPHYLLGLRPGGGGCFNNSDGPSDWASDHSAMDK